MDDGQTLAVTPSAYKQNHNSANTSHVPQSQFAS